MNRGKVLSGLVALSIYLGIVFLILFFYNIHKAKAKNYVEKNSDRVTVTLVNSNKTVFNKSSKKSIPKKPKPIVTPPKKTVRAVKPIPVPKKIIPKKVVPKKIVPKKTVPKRAKKVIPKPPKKHVVPKKKIPKKVPKKHLPKKKVPKKKVPKKSAKALFSSIKTDTPVKKRQKKPVKHPVKQPSHIKHNSSVTDAIKATHQSGRVSNANRERGIENAYIARVKRHMQNWDAVGMKGQLVTIHLTVYNSGKFRYTVSGVNGSMRSSLKRYLDTLNRMGLGRHKKSSPYSIQVRFRVH
jgi:hypothetical protein